MSAFTASFSAFTPTYENIANRMSRLKYTKNSQSITQIRSSSLKKTDLNAYPIDTRPSSPYQPKRRISPSGQAFLEQQFASTGEQFAGRVSKNTGIKKYNQRQLKDIGEGRTVKHLKTESSVDRTSVFYPLDNWGEGNRKDAWGTKM